MAEPNTACPSAETPVPSTDSTSTPVEKNATALRYRAVEVAVGYTERHIRRLVRQGTFPAPHKINGGVTLAWTAESIEAWLASKTGA